MQSEITVTGITGLAGSGKSHASGFIRKFGYPVIELDRVGHFALYDPEIKDKISSEFGTEVFDKYGSVNRKELGRVVFSDLESLARLNSISWPWMHFHLSKLLQNMRRTDIRHVFIDAAVLFTGNFVRYCDQVLWVDCDQKTILKRLSERCTTEKARSILESQQDLIKFREKSQLFIDNNGSLQELEQKISEILKAMAA